MKYEFVKSLFKNRHNHAAYSTYYTELGSKPPVVLLEDFKKKLKSKKILEELENKAFFKKNFFSEYHVKALNTLISLEQSTPKIEKILTNDKVLEQCLILFASSNSLSWSFIKHASAIGEIFPILPETLSEYRLRLGKTFDDILTDFHKLNHTPSPTTTETEVYSPATLETLESFAKKIRLVKIAEFIRIALADYMDEDSLETTAGKISAFADLVIKATFEAAELSESPVGGGARAGVGVIAMGKLGGNELNYSSDIDLIFIGEQQLPHRDKVVLQKIRMFIALLSETKEDGNVFKVDMQIRPEGNAGELYLSPKATMDYYNTRSSSWERQALIKARFITGPPALENSFKELQNYIIFQKEFSSEKMLMDIFYMKEKIEKDLSTKISSSSDSTEESPFTAEDHPLIKNVKLGSGGIRDIEFLVQFLQLHHGRLTPALNENNTLKALKKLFNYKILSSDETVTLTDNYRFLRKIEHRLQLIDLLAVRELPSEIRELDYLSGLCGYFQDKKAQKFIQDYELATKETRALFDKVFKHTTLFQTKMIKLKETLGIPLEESLSNPPTDSSSTDSSPKEKSPQENSWQEELQKFESDYFLQFSSTQIKKHLKMLQDLSETTPVYGEIVIKNNQISIEIVTYSIIGSFSLIAGHISTKGINILNGFVFPQIDEKVGGRDSPDHFYRRSFAAWEESSKPPANDYDHRQSSKDAKNAKSMGSLIRSNRKKAVVRIEGEFTQKKHLKSFQKEGFLSELSEYFELNFKGEQEKIRETIYLRALPFLEKHGKQFNIKPVSITIDNDSHLFYTMLRIKSEDFFLFLYQFTFSLSERRFRIAKAEFATEDKQIDNVIYITERNREKVTAQERINEIKATLLLLNYFSSYIVFAPNPYLAFSQFSRLVHRIVDDYDTAFAELLRGGPIFKKLARILGTSQAIFEDFFRSEAVNVFHYLSSEETLKTPHTEDYLEKLIKKILRQKQYTLKTAIKPNPSRKKSLSKLSAKPSPELSPKTPTKAPVMLTTQKISRQAKDSSVQPTPEVSAIELLNRFKDDVMFTIDLRFLAGEVKRFQIFCEEISTLTDVVIRETYRILEQEQLKKFSLTKPPGESAILCLGKWGGREMGYSSDIEIMFVYRIFEKTENSHDPTRSKLFFEELGRKFPLAIKSKKNGIFELDFRLRPDGESAPVAISFNKFKNYYTFKNPNVRNFERMTLTKLRALESPSHSKALIADLIKIVNDFVFAETPFDKEEFKRLRKLQIKELTREGRFNVKFSLGGLVAIEYYIQKQIILHGKAFPKVRKPNTLLAMKALHQNNLLPTPTYEALVKSYHFYRTLINSLRIVRGNAQDLEIPLEGSAELQYLIRRVSLFKALKSNENLLDKLKKNLEIVKEITRTTDS